MAKFIFAYHGGDMPEKPQEIEQVMADWESWLSGMGVATLDPGAPVGQSYTVNQDASVTNNGGANPISGYSIVEAGSLEDALEMAKGCPNLAANGTVEVAEMVEM